MTSVPVFAQVFLICLSIPIGDRLRQLFDGNAIVTEGFRLQEVFCTQYFVFRKEVIALPSHPINCEKSILIEFFKKRCAAPERTNRCVLQTFIITWWRFLIYCNRHSISVPKTLCFRVVSQSFQSRLFILQYGTIRRLTCILKKYRSPNPDPYPDPGPNKQWSGSNTARRNL